MNRLKYKILVMVTLLLLMNAIPSTYAWSNGGWSTDINNPKDGTHDQILVRAIDMLPSDMKNKINIVAAKYGTEIPDCNVGIYCIGDSTTKHHVYYRSTGNLQDDIGAKRAQEEYDQAKSSFQSGDNYNFSLHIGAMSHYMSDLAVFGHTMGANTDWGAEKNHSKYELYVENHPEFVNGVTFDNKLDSISAYNAALAIAKDTTFDNNEYTNVWMDKNYDWSNPNYVQRTKDSINYGTNSIADVIYTMMIIVNPVPTYTVNPVPTGTIDTCENTVTSYINGVDIADIKAMPNSFIPSFYEICKKIPGQTTSIPIQSPIPAQPAIPTMTPTQVSTPAPTPAITCDPSYPDVCIPPYPPDLNCADIPYKNFKVLPPDPHRFDADKDGVGCET